jgi:hypothetical protein
MKDLKKLFSLIQEKDVVCSIIWLIAVYSFLWQQYLSHQLPLLAWYFHDSNTYQINFRHWPGISMTAIQITSTATIGQVFLWQQYISHQLPLLACYFYDSNTYHINYNYWQVFLLQQYISLQLPLLTWYFGCTLMWKCSSLGCGRSVFSLASPLMKVIISLKYCFYILTLWCSSPWADIAYRAPPTFEPF